jgi:plastocyanin
MRLGAAGLLAVLPALAAALPGPSDLPLPHGTEEAEAASTVPVGSIGGTVTVRLPAPRRAASRYPGAPTQAPSVQPIPAMVYIQGPVPGTPARVDGNVAEVAQRDTAFVPGALVVPVGTVLRFPNEDDFFHNVFSYSAAARFDLGRYPRGESKDVTLTEPGLVKIYCEVHEFMRAAVVVAENTFGAVVDDQGRFLMEGVPAGTYTVVFWHPDLDPVERTVTVSDGQTARIDVELR